MKPDEHSQAFEALRGLAEVPSGAVMVIATDLRRLVQELDITQAALETADEGYRRALQDAGLAEARCRELEKRLKTPQIEQPPGKERAMDPLTKVLLESPFGAPSTLAEHEYRQIVDKNLEYLRAAMNDCFKRGEAPFASHGLYTQPGVLNDKSPEERKLGIEAGLQWGAAAEKSVVYVDRGISGGMKQGITRAFQESRPVEFRSLGEEWLSYSNIVTVHQTLAFLCDLVSQS